ncbi:hypothetical protein ACFL1P_00770 [Patescibacteria group bacterium]
MASNSSSNQISLKGLGVTTNDDRILLYYSLIHDNHATLHASSSIDGLDISEQFDDPTILLGKKNIDPIRLSNFRISKNNHKNILVYSSELSDSTQLYIAESSDFVNWNRIGSTNQMSDAGMIIPDYRYKDQYVMYFGNHSICMATSKDLKKWTISDSPVLEARNDHLGTLPLSVGGIITTHEGIVLLYYAREEEKNGEHYSIHTALLDKDDPKKLIWLSDTIWEQNGDWANDDVTPLGIVYFKGKLISYWDSKKHGIFAIPHTTLTKALDTNITPHIMLSRHNDNPIIKPIVKHYWESRATFNAAALYDKGKVHLLYRALGDHDTSVIGYASSSDGVNVDERHPEPIYTPTQPFETPQNIAPGTALPNSFVSGGGGYGGCEDPRITKIGNRMYMTYVAYDGANPPRVAMTSISSVDFHNHTWNWDTPVLISKPGEVNKNCVIFPEKINGKYVIMHRVYPNILFDFVDDLQFDGESKFLNTTHTINPTRTGWDSRKVGAGPPPIKTPEGWLLVYHAVGEGDPGRYKIGSMLLDLQDPTKVLYRTRRPILSPDERHENDGFKAGIAYPCGAVQKEKDLIVYYGGADTVVCAARANMNTFLDGLINTGSTSVEPISFSQSHQHEALYAHR